MDRRYPHILRTRGAEKVIALEPHPYSFSLLRENIEFNGMQDIIVPLNAGISDKRGVVYVKYETSDTGNLSLQDMLSNTGRGVQVELLTLSDVVWMADMFDGRGLALKMDCEGCEYDVLLKANLDELRRFDEIILEYHDEPKPLIEVLTKAKFRAGIVARYEEKIGFNPC